LQVAELQTLPVPQLVPSARLVQAAVEVAGWQLWQAFPGSMAPLA